MPDGTWETVGGGEKKELARALALATLSSAMLEALFEVVLRVGTQAHE